MLSVADRLAITELAGRFAFAIDFHNGAAMADCFTDDGAFEWYAPVPFTPGAEELRCSAKGGAELTAFGAGTRAIAGTPAASRAPGGPVFTGPLHVTSNHTVEEVGGTVTHRCYLVGAGGIGVYTGEVVRAGEQWKFKHRKIVAGNH